jgi:hypothetical protein
MKWSGEELEQSEEQMGPSWENGLFLVHTAASVIRAERINVEIR